MFKAREKILDGVLITSVFREIKDKMKDAVIYSDILGSDHCPVGLLLTRKYFCNISNSLIHAILYYSL